MNYQLLQNIETKLQADFQKIDEIALQNQQKVLQAFIKHKVRQQHFAPSNGYAYGDIGRETLNQLYATVLGFDNAIVSHALSCGTHTIFAALRGLLRPNDHILSITGTVYDSVQSTMVGKIGSLAEYGIHFESIDLLPNGDFDKETLFQKLQDNLNFINSTTQKTDKNTPVAVAKNIDKNAKTQNDTTYKAPPQRSHSQLIYIQRACGYSSRKALLPNQIEEIATFIKSIHQDIIILVDNCYGEFVCNTEPQKNIDVLVGSLIKNTGGGIAQCGGYIASKQKYIDTLNASVTAPGIGGEVGANLYGYRDYFLGLYLAPHIVAQAKKSALLFGQGFADLGYTTNVQQGITQADIVVSIGLHNEQNVIKFCHAIQSLSPVDSFVTPLPWDMPGYDNPIIMCAGTFTAGSTIELSADAPMRPPYNVYLQGALTYEHAKIAFCQTYALFAAQPQN